MTTPKVIYQTWKTRTNLPPKLKALSDKWRTLHPEYDHVILDDDDLREIVKDTVPEYLDVYDLFTHVIERVDFARYALMYSKGGIYADLDMDPLKNIDSFIAINKPVFGCEPKEHSLEIYGRDRVVCNAILISPPGQKVWKELMDFIIKEYEPKFKPVNNTGPLAVTHFLDGNSHHEKDIVITDPCVFYPLKSDGTVSKECNIKESYTAHIWENTWVQPWYKDPMWFNMRYWFWGLISIFAIVWFICFFREKKK